MPADGAPRVKGNHGICHCSHPACPACKGGCTAPGTKAVSVRYQGEARGAFRFCGPCEQGWQTMDDMDIKPVAPGGQQP